MFAGEKTVRTQRIVCWTEIRTDLDGSVSTLIDVYFHTVLFPAVQMADGGNWTMLTNISGTR
jgi:hypothetical protein